MQESLYSSLLTGKENKYIIRSVNLKEVTVMDIRTILHIITPVVIGAVIGYFTNYLAIKMLFRPYNEHHLGKHKIPFTPGIIPRNRSKMAAAVGKAVSSRLLTPEDLAGTLTNSGAKKEITEALTDAVFNSDISISGITGEEEAEKSDLALELADGLAEKIKEKLLETDMQPIIDGALSEITKEYRRNPMIGMFLTDKVMLAADIKIEEGIKAYVRENGSELFSSYITEMIGSISHKPLCEAAKESGVSRETVSAAAEKGFDVFAEKIAAEIPKRIDISGMIRDKIDGMDVRELEELLMSVMKNELQAVVNLGAVLGAIIGTINIFI